MQLETFLAFVLGIVGTSGVILFLIKFTSNAALSLVLKSIDSKNSRDIEKLKTTLGNKMYISKIRFDTEFAIYRDLSATFFDAVLQVNMIIPHEEESFNRVLSAQREYKKENYDLAVLNMKIARDTLHKNAPFIDGDFYDKYDEIIALMRVQIDNFAFYYDFKYNNNRISEKTDLTKDDMEQSVLLVEMLSGLNEKIRNYLKTLEVIE